MFNTSQKINLTYFSGIEKSTDPDNKRKIVPSTAYITIHQPIALYIHWIDFYLLNTYTLFDGLAYNTCRYFASCIVFFRPQRGRGKIRAMSKMAACIIC